MVESYSRLPSSTNADYLTSPYADRSRDPTSPYRATMIDMTQARPTQWVASRYC
jgi:hypothetical protein